MANDKDVIIIGAGIGGLSLALALHQAAVPFRIYEAAAELKPLGVGLNLLPHAIKALSGLGLQEKLLAKGIETGEYCFYTRHGQLIYREPRGRAAGYDWPQISIHRGDLHGALLDAAKERLGANAVVLGHKCVGLEQDASGVTVRFVDPQGVALPPARGAVSVACDGVHSAARQQFHPAEAVPRYEGTTQYRGTTRWKPFLTGASMAYLGTYETGKLIIYPIRNDVDGEGRQLINWVIESVAAERPAAARLEPQEPGRGVHRQLRALHLRLARHPGGAAGGGRRVRVPDGRPGPAAVLDRRPHHAARRCRPSDDAARIERRGPGDHRCDHSRRPARGRIRLVRGAEGSTRRSASRRPRTSSSPTAGSRPTRSSASSRSAPAASPSRASRT